MREESIALQENVKTRSHSPGKACRMSLLTQAEWSATKQPLLLHGAHQSNALLHWPRELMASPTSPSMPMPQWSEKWDSSSGSKKWNSPSTNWKEKIVGQNLVEKKMPGWWWSPAETKQEGDAHPPMVLQWSRCMGALLCAATNGCLSS
ncbi:hypothetical protein SRHO_G00295310 [Serrasalmus rhombeus]